jgi:TetR/AcrR family transcriptional regulator, cholesterol catabolism regulator
MAKADAQRVSVRRNREEEVIQAAIDVFWQKGYSAASIQDVADRVGVLKGSLYHYIDSKEDLLFQIFNESHSQGSELIEEIGALDATAIVRLTIYLERYLLWYLENLERVSLYLSEWRHLAGERRKRVLEQRRMYEDFIVGLIREAQAQGDVRADLNPKHACFFLLGAVNAVPSWYRRNGKDRPADIASSYGQLILSALTGAYVHAK